MRSSVVNFIAPIAPFDSVRACSLRRCPAAPLSSTVKAPALTTQPMPLTARLRLGGTGQLDWKQRAGLELWYRTPPTCPLVGALEKYERANDAPAPVPQYGDSHRCCREHFGAEDGPEQSDTRFELLQLCCKDGHPVWRVVAPLSHTRDRLDFGLSWHLWMFLQAMGVVDRSEHQEIDMYLQAGYMDQLEAAGQWKWAVFVALQLHAPARTRAVKALLQRHCVSHAEQQSSASWKDAEEFLTHKLHVPAAWIAEAKAMRASYDGRGGYDALAHQLPHLTDAGLWQEAHIGVLRALPRFFLRDQLHDVRALLHSVRAGARACSEVHEQRGEDALYDWEYRGLLLLYFIELKESTLKDKPLLRNPEERERLSGLAVEIANAANRLHERSHRPTSRCAARERSSRRSPPHSSRAPRHRAAPPPPPRSPPTTNALSAND